MLPDMGRPVKNVESSVALEWAELRDEFPEWVFTEGCTGAGMWATPANSPDYPLAIAAWGLRRDVYGATPVELRAAIKAQYDKRALLYRLLDWANA